MKGVDPTFPQTNKVKLFNTFGEYDEFQGMIVSGEVFYALVAMRINAMSDGELMGAILARKVKSAKTAVGPMCMMMQHAARKRGLAES